MENKENKEIKKAEVVKPKKERIFKTKELIFTGIVSFLVGAIVTTAGFTIAGKTHHRADFKDGKQDGIQRKIGPGEFDNNYRQNGHRNRQMPNDQQGNNGMKAPNDQSSTNGMQVPSDDKGPNNNNNLPNNQPNQNNQPAKNNQTEQNNNQSQNGQDKPAEQNNSNTQNNKS